MKAYSKEFDEAMAFFEKTNKGLRFDKPSRDEREKIPKGEWYNSGETTKLFKMFLSGVEYGRSVNENLDSGISDKILSLLE